MDNITNNSTSPGPPLYEDLQIQLFLRIFYGILASVSIIGNTLVVAVIATYKRGSMLKYGPNLLITSMAVMDMMTGIIIFIMPSFVFPPSSFVYPLDPIGGVLFCRLLISQYLLFYFGFGSVITITAISVERWIAVAKPHRYKSIITAKRIKIFLIFLWLTAFVLPIDAPLQYNFAPVAHNSCYINNFFDSGLAQSLFVLLEFIRLYLPVFLTIICYCDIARRILLRTKIESLTRESAATWKARRRVTVMSASAALAFIMCWLPNEIYFTAYALKLTPFNVTTIRITKSLIVLSSCLSPFIYSATNEKYRRGLRTLMSSIMNCTCIECKHKRLHSTPVSELNYSVEIEL